MVLSVHNEDIAAMKLPNIREVVVVVVLTPSHQWLFLSFLLRKKLLYVHSTYSIIFHVFRKM
jgi:hypothetical protein